MLNTNHYLYKLSEAIDWASLEKQITRLMDTRYAPQWRLVSGSIYLNSFYDLSTADVMKGWSECVYLRFFCSGELSPEVAKPFPVPLAVLEQLSIDLAGEGYDAMIRALPDNRPFIETVHTIETAYDESPTVH